MLVDINNLDLSLWQLTGVHLSLYDDVLSQDTMAFLPVVLCMHAQLSEGLSSSGNCQVFGIDLVLDSRPSCCCKHLLHCKGTTTSCKPHIPALDRKP